MATWRGEATAILVKGGRKYGLNSLYRNTCIFLLFLLIKLGVYEVCFGEIKALGILLIWNR